MRCDYDVAVVGGGIVGLAHAWMAARRRLRVVLLERSTAQGIYARHPKLPVFEAETDNGVQVFVGTGGAGMTMAFGLAERSWKRWMGEVA